MIYPATGIEVHINTWKYHGDIHAAEISEQLWRHRLSWLRKKRAKIINQYYIDSKSYFKQAAKKMPTTQAKTYDWIRINNNNNKKAQREIFCSFAPDLQFYEEPWRH